MISLIIVGEKSHREAYTQKFCEAKKISIFDRIVITKIQDPQKKTLQALGIEDIREVQEKLYNKPLKSEEKLVIFVIETITTEAQNALLKVLEEPPNNTTIMLSLGSTRYLLPTILSRCKVITVGKLVKEKGDWQETDFNLLLNGKIGDKLKSAEVLGKSKEAALDFLLSAMQQLRKKLHQCILEENMEPTSIAHYQKIFERFNNAYTTIASTNVNPRFALENLFLSFE